MQDTEVCRALVVIRNCTRVAPSSQVYVIAHACVMIPT